MEEEGLRISQGDGHHLGCNRRLWCDLGGIRGPRKGAARLDKGFDVITNEKGFKYDFEGRQHMKVRDFDDRRWHSSDAKRKEIELSRMPD